ncbi:hypothetical protein [Marivita sp. S2033]|uniref:hypothetical protein n=1 Tax=Marivita sp. S2033 TaxID=3373187 RepID=UPI003982CE64
MCLIANNKLLTVGVVVVLALQLLFPEGLKAQEARASLAAELSFFDHATRRSIRPADGKPIGLRVELTDVTTGRAPRGLTLAGWVRTRSPRNTGCEAAAQAFRVTAQPALGSVDLNGILAVTLNEDASVGVIDPKLNLQSSNMIAAAKLDTFPSAMTVDPRSFRAFFVTEGESGITSLSLLTGKTTRHFETGSDLATILGSENGGLWVGRADGQIFPFDSPNALRRVGEGAISLRMSAEPESALMAAFASAGGLLIFDGATGSPILALPKAEAVVDLAVLADGAVITLPIGADSAHVIYPDAPGNPVEIPLGFSAQRIVASPSGRHAIAYTPGQAAAVVIDVARAEVVQPLELTRSVLSEVTFTDAAAYLLSLDGGFVGLIDLRSVAIGKPAQILRVDLARKSSRPLENGGLLVPLWPSPQVIAVSPEAQTGWLLHDDHAVGDMPPMNSIRLRGGVPARVAVVDRSFREVEPGVFETVALVQGGDHELVLTTGIGGLSVCLGFAVRGASDQPGIEVISLSLDRTEGRIAAGKEIDISAVFRDSAGSIIPVQRAEFQMSSLASSWSDRTIARSAPDGSLRVRVRFPHPGPFALQPVALPENLYLQSPVLLEVSR